MSEDTLTRTADAAWVTAVLPTRPFVRMTLSVSQGELYGIVKDMGTGRTVRTFGVDRVRPDGRPLVEHPTIAELMADFDRSPKPKLSDFVGDWVETAVVYSAGPSYNSGVFKGPDRITADTMGIVRDNGKLDWEMTLTRTGDTLAFIARGTLFRYDPRVPVTLTSAGTLVFSVDYGGDFGFNYKCRLPTPKRMVCIADIERPGHGLEFRRVR